MEKTRILRHAGVYFLLTTIAGIIGLTIVAAGAALSAAQAMSVYSSANALDGGIVLQILEEAAAGIVVAVIGIALWRFGKAVAFYATITSAI
ncbi:MAG: hypothetical protein ABEI52_03195, partial [Halobacteriaceae archaeon]